MIKYIRIWNAERKLFEHIKNKRVLFLNNPDGTSQFALHPEILSKELNISARIIGKALSNLYDGGAILRDSNGEYYCEILL